MILMIICSEKKMVRKIKFCICNVDENECFSSVGKIKLYHSVTLLKVFLWSAINDKTENV